MRVKTIAYTADPKEFKTDFRKGDSNDPKIWNLQCFFNNHYILKSSSIHTSYMFACVNLLHVMLACQTAWSLTASLHRLTPLQYN